MKIMVCYDGSDRSKNALGKTLEIFGPQNPDVILLMVAEDPGDASMQNEEIASGWRKEHQNKLRDAAEMITDQGFETTGATFRY